MNTELTPPGKGKLWVPDHVGENYLAVLRRLHELLRPTTYLEIGCGKGSSLALADCAVLAIDPRPRLDLGDVINRRPLFALYRMTSDAFFARHDPAAVLGAPIDIAFLDGMHLCEYLLRDFINVERCSHRCSTIVLHDCLPVEWPMADRTRNAYQPIRAHHKHSWAGDVWRTALLLKRRRPDLQITAYAAPPTGLVCVTNLSPGSLTLRDSYDQCLQEMMEQSLQEMGIETLFSVLNVEPTSALGERGAVSAPFNP
jgi:hypothetical protein